MAAGAQAQGPRMRHHGLDPLRLDGVVELELAVAVSGIPVDGGQRIGQVVGHEVGLRRERALALDEAVGRDARPENIAALDAAAQLGQLGVGVADVAHRGHASGQVQQQVDRCHMGVHVDQPRQQCSALAADALGRLGLDEAARPGDGGDAAIEQVDVGRPAQHRRLGVEPAHALDDRQPRQRLRQLTGQALQVGQLGGLLRVGQAVHLRLEALQHGPAPAWVDLGEQRAVVLTQPHIAGRQVQAGDGVQADLIGLAGQAQALHALDGQATHGQGLGARRLGREQALCQPRREGWRGLQRQVDGLTGRTGLLAAVHRRAPDSLAIGLALEALVNPRAVGGHALGPVAQPDAVGGEGRHLLLVGPAAVVAVAVVRFQPLRAGGHLEVAAGRLDADDRVGLCLRGAGQQQRDKQGRQQLHGNPRHGLVETHCTEGS